MMSFKSGEGKRKISTSTVPYSKRPLKVLLFPIGWDANKSKFTPQHFTMSAQWFSSAHLYSRVGKAR